VDLWAWTEFVSMTGQLSRPEHWLVKCRICMDATVGEMMFRYFLTGSYWLVSLTSLCLEVNT